MFIACAVFFGVPASAQQNWVTPPTPPKPVVVEHDPALDPMPETRTGMAQECAQFSDAKLDPDISDHSWRQECLRHGPAYTQWMKAQIDYDTRDERHTKAMKDQLEFDRAEKLLRALGGE
jgi:hypothetical protein